MNISLIFYLRIHAIASVCCRPKDRIRVLASTLSIHTVHVNEDPAGTAVVFISETGVKQVMWIRSNSQPKVRNLPVSAGWKRVTSAGLGAETVRGGFTVARQLPLTDAVAHVGRQVLTGFRWSHPRTSHGPERRKARTFRFHPVGRNSVS